MTCVYIENGSGLPRFGNGHLPAIGRKGAWPRAVKSPIAGDTPGFAPISGVEELVVRAGAGSYPSIIGTKLNDGIICGKSCELFARMGIPSLRSSRIDKAAGDPASVTDQCQRT